MISDSFRSNISVAHTISSGCACLFLHMSKHRWGNVCACFKHCISSCKRQAIKPRSPVPSHFSGTTQRLISSLPPPTGFVDIRMVTDTWSRLVVYSSDQMFPPSQRGEVIRVAGVFVCVHLKTWCVSVCLVSSINAQSRLLSPSMSFLFQLWRILFVKMMVKVWCFFFLIKENLGWWMTCQDLLLKIRQFICHCRHRTKVSPAAIWILTHKFQEKKKSKLSIRHNQKIPRATAGPL